MWAVLREIFFRAFYSIYEAKLEHFPFRAFSNGVTGVFIKPLNRGRQQEEEAIDLGFQFESTNQSAVTVETDGSLA